MAVVSDGAGIPIVYYGSEQGFNGGADPNNRESLWPHYNQNSELFNFVKGMVAARKKFQVWNLPQVQRYAADNFYAFSRGNVLVCLTNGGQGSSVSINVSYLPYSQGTVVCNVLDSSQCMTVGSSGLQITLSNGQPLVLAPKQ